MKNKNIRKPLIAGNWKMNMTGSETLEFINGLKGVSLSNEVDTCIVAPFTSLQILSEEVKNSKVYIGAQNMYYEDKGAFTGEISPLMLNDLGIDYVIIGHSERRNIFNEDDEIINKKVISALKHGINPILCCGENLEERESDKQEFVVENQIRNNLKDLSGEDIASKLVIAYEPIWAIGTGKTASADDAQKMCKFIRDLISKMYDSTIAETIKIQYGGSVKPSNISEIMSKEDIDGALVGGASLEFESFSKLVNYGVSNE